ncbi:uncharacterized protein DFL_004733 [Arthrobotrys flagrans]|uniref:Uncharacterized protein n=1 Tax=Arthrobotrys flagrans TaxID=97331 RepID=A0A437A5Q9_ARTFL|nr:hypothetical protein DFL_004733 [Arthrobotrys flagrans]
MPNRTEDRQTFLADPHRSFKTTRYGDKPITYRRSPSAYDQSTLSQFGFTPRPSSANSKKHKWTSVASKNSGAKRRNLNFDNLKHDSSEGEEEEEEDGVPVGKKRRVGQGHLSSDDEDKEGNIELNEEEMGDDSFVVNDHFGEDDEASWRPIRAPKRRRSLPKRRRFLVSKTRDLTLTQMYPLTRIPVESDYEEEEEESQEEYIEGEESQEEDIQVKDEPVSQAAYESEAWVKNEPQSQAEMPEDLMPSQRFKQEDEDTEPSGRVGEVKQENMKDEFMEEPTTTVGSEILGLPNNPKTPKRPIPSVVPSSYTPPVTPLSPLRHQQLSAILASPSIQRQWRMSGRKLPGFTTPNLGPVTEHQKRVDDSSTEENTPIEPDALAQPLKRPDFTKDSVGADALTGTSSGSGVKETEPGKPKVVQSTQWWEREETFTSNSATTLEPIQEVDSQPEVQVTSNGDVQNNEAVSTTPAAPRVVQPGEIDVARESPVRRNRSKNWSFKPSLSTSMSREPLLRDSSGLHTINTSFFRKESSTIEPPPQAAENESQKSQVSIESVDRRLMNESDGNDKTSADRVEETQVDESDPDATISQSQPEELETTPRAPVRKPTLPSRKGSNLLLHPPSSPPQTYRFVGNINSTPPSSKDIFYSPSSKGSSSPIMEFKNMLETFEPQERDREDLNEGTETSASYPGKGSVETLTQWKMRMFGPSQAVPTISQILGANSLANDAEDDDEEEDEEL